jgi:PAS domain S-box-containing protein
MGTPVHHLEEGTLSQFGAPLAGYFDLRLVALSFLISILASYVALDLAVRVTAARGKARRAWLAAGAISMGLGIWSMHFVGMLAFILPIPVRYHVLTVLLSLLAAILTSSIALHLASGERFGRREALVGSLMMGSGIAAMHCLGMAAMRLPATCHYNPLLLGLSIMIAVVAALAALSFAFNFHDEPQGTWVKVTAAVVMGIAIASMYYTGMASASFVTSDLTVDFSHSLSVSWLGTAGIVIVTLMVLGFTLLMTLMGRQFTAQALRLDSSEQLEQQSRAVIDAIPQQIWSGPADGTLDFGNERWRSYMGLGLEELQGAGWQKMLHPDDRDRVLNAWHESVANGTPYEQEERHRGADGQYRWFLVRGVPLRDAGGRIVRWYGTNTDIEDLKRAEEELRRGEAYLAAAQRMTRMGIWSWNPSSGDMVGSQELYRIFGIDQAKTKLTREIFLQSIHPEDRSRYDSEINAAVTERRNWELDYRIVLQDGSFQYVQAIGRPVFTVSGEVLQFVGPRWISRTVSRPG